MGKPILCFQLQSSVVFSFMKYRGSHFYTISVFRYKEKYLQYFSLGRCGVSENKKETPQAQLA